MRRNRKSFSPKIESLEARELLSSHLVADTLMPETGHSSTPILEPITKPPVTIMA